MITEALGNMEPEMDVEQDVSEEQGRHEPKAQEQPSRPQLPTPPAFHDEHGGISNREAEEEGKHSTEDLGSTLENTAARQKDSTDPAGAVVLSSMQDPTVAHPLVLEDGLEDIPTAQILPDATGLPSENYDVGAVVSSPSRKRSKGRAWKKNGGKKAQDKDIGESPVEVSHSRDAGTRTDQFEFRNSAQESDLVPNVSDTVQQRETEGHAVGSESTSKEKPHNADVLEPESMRGVSREEDVVVEDKHGDAEPSLLSLKALRSFGRWADVSEDIDARATDAELERSPNQSIRADMSGNRQEEEHRGKTEQTFEGSRSEDIRTGTWTKSKEQALRGKNRTGGEGSQNDKIREGTGNNHKEHDQRGKSRQDFEGSRNWHDVKADTWSNLKEQDLRGKTLIGRDSVSQASRESNWRRRPVEPRVRQDTPRSTSKLGHDSEPKKDEQQDFRARSQYGAEPQATHKNWIPRRGLQKSEGEGRAEQIKIRGKGKQGREADQQNQFTKDFARQKFEADLRVKQEELLQKSKLTLKIEFQKAKRIEQARKGGDELEMELNKNLVYEGGQLFYLNL